MPGPTPPPDEARKRPALTGRALVLGAVLVLLVVVLAAPVARYLASRSDVAHAAQQLHNDREEQARLQARKQRFSDPGYIEAQARSRLQFAMPGDIVYTVVRNGQPTGIEQSRASSHDDTAGGTPWTARLWTSVEAAGR